jgi:hypothetical protein
LSVRKAALGAIEQNIGLQFPDFKPDAPPGLRMAAVNRMRATIARMKSVYDRETDARINRQSSNPK